MFRSALAAALRHLHRGKLYTFIAVAGLAIGVWAALLAGLYVHSQYSYDHFVADYEDLYLVNMRFGSFGGSMTHIPDTPGEIAPALEQRFPEIRSVSRAARQYVRLRVGEKLLAMPMSAVDPDFLATVPLSVVAGDAVLALAQPDLLVLTREQALIIFGSESVLGRPLTIQLSNGSRHEVKVGAVIENIPRNRSQLQAGMFVSGVSAWTSIAAIDRRSAKRNGLFSEVRTFVRLNAGASPDNVRMGLQQILREIVGPEAGIGAPDLGLVRVDRVHTDEGMNPGITSRLLMTSALGLVVLLISVINFVNLLTSRLSARTLEVGIRKLAGAGRPVLALQFIGEAVAYVAVAVLLGIAMTEWSVPYMNAFLDVGAEFGYWRQPGLIGLGLVAVVGLGTMVGIWPAAVLSSLQPLRAMHGARLARGGGGMVRKALVSLQFALLIAVVVCAGVVFLQHRYATHKAMSFDTEQMLIVEESCTPARLAEVRKLSAVRDAACSSTSLTGDSWGTTDGKTRNGTKISVSIVWVDEHTLDLFGIRPVAGRGLVAADIGNADQATRRYLINETAVRLLGFDSAAAAIGPHKLMDSLDEIVGVLPDFSMGSVERHIEPTAYFANSSNLQAMNIKLKTGDIPAALAKIDQVVANTGTPGQINRYFYDERVERMYRAMLREAQSFGIVSLVAVLLSCLGMLGLSAVITEQRTREIGIRKALGARTADVLRLLLWQFSRPVVWANLIAWPASAWVMQRWLNRFAYHIDLPLWVFPAAAFAALIVGIGTVSAHSIMTARARPVLALRRE